MSFVVLESSSPGQFEVVIHDLNLVATVTDRSEVAAAWVETVLKTLNDVDITHAPNTNTGNHRHLIVGIRTNDMNGRAPTFPASAAQPRPNRRPNPGTPFFGDINPLIIATPATAADPSTSKSPTASSSKSSIIYNHGVELTSIPSLSSFATTDPSASSSNAVDLAKLLPPTDASSSTTSALEIKEIITKPSVPSSSRPITHSNLKAPMDPSASSSFSSAVRKSSTGNLATLQLCCGKKCLIFSLLYNDRGIPNELVNFLFDRNLVTLVGTGVRRDGDWLGRPQSILIYRDPWELAEARAWCGLQHFRTLDQLARELLGREKAIRLQPVPVSNRWPLTENQKLVACLEAYILSEIGQKLAEISRESFATCYFMCSL